METVTVVASFPDTASADGAARRFADPASEIAGADAKLGRSAGEGRFIVRLALIIAAWSVIGTAIGGGIGALLSYTIGPHSTEGFILQVVTWAIFAHLLIGLWAGYALLADRSGRELADEEPTIAFEVRRADAPALARALQQAGASKVVIQTRPAMGSLTRR